MTDITEVCAYCRNYFAPKSKRESGEYKHAGTFTVNDQSISPFDFLKEGQYFRIVGSDLNEGVYCNTTEGMGELQDETFTGEIWEMAVPRAFLAMCEDIAAWRTANEAVDSSNMSPFTSESFGGYSYTKSGSNTASGSNATWQGQFSARLNAWKRIYI
jgi:hypothetical protein